MKRSGSIAEGVGLVEIEPPQSPSGENVIEVHAHSHEARGRPGAQFFGRQSVAMRKRIDPTVLLCQPGVNGGAGQCIEIAYDEEAIAFALPLHETHQILRLFQLILPPSESTWLRPKGASPRAG